MSTNAPADGAHGSTPNDAMAAELARLKAERDEAVAAREHLERRTRRRGRVRRVIVGVFVVLFAVLLPVTVVAGWVHRTVLDTDTYVDTVAPIAAEPAVTAAVSRQVTDQLYEALDPQAIIAESLPPRAAFLAGPIANGARNSVEDAVNKIIASDQFQQLWVNANRTAHASIVTVLRGDGEVLQTTGGQVVINLVPLLNEALRNTEGFVSGVVGKPVTLPEITSDELPSVACQKISAALDRPLPDTCGQISLFSAKRLDNAQRAVSWFDSLVIALLIVTPLVAVAALLLSRRRRRTLLQLTISAGLGLVVVRRLLMWEQNQLEDIGRPENKEARTAIVDGVLSGFFDLTWWILLGLLAVIAIALLTGPYRWAVATRNAVVTGGRRVGSVVYAGAKGAAVRTQDEETVAWVRGHFDLLRVAGVAVAVFLLVAVDVNFWSFLVIIGLLALYEVWLYRLRPPEPSAAPTVPPSTPAPRVAAESAVPGQPTGGRRTPTR